MHSSRRNSWNPIKAAQVKPENDDIDAHLAMGLAEVLGIWVKDQCKLDVKLKKGLTEQQLAFLFEENVNPRRFGCALPPSSTAMPDVRLQDFDFTKA